MNTFNTYFKRHFLSSWAKVVIYSVIGAVFMTQSINSKYISYLATIKTDPNYLITNSMVDILIIFVAVIALITPILEFYQFNNKNNLDTLFSLPISKSKMLLVHYVNGAIQIAMAFTATYLIWLFAYVCADFTELHVGYAYLAYPILLLCALCIYTIFSFIFLQANNTVDGCVFIVLHVFLFAITGSLVEYLFRQSVTISDRYVVIFGKFVLNAQDHAAFFNGLNNFIENFVENLNFISILSQLQRVLDFAISPISSYKEVGATDNKYIEYVYNYTYRGFNIDPVQAWLFAISIAMAIVSFVIMIKSFKGRNSSIVGETSESWFGYKTLGALYSICGMILWCGDYSISIIWLILTFLGYTLYRRGVKFKIPDIVVMAVTTVLAILGEGFIF